MKTTFLPAAFLAVPMALLLPACAPDKPQSETLRPVRTIEIRYDAARQSNRYVGTVQARHEVEQAFRVGGKLAERRVEVGQAVREGDVLAVLDDADYRLAEQTSRQQWIAATTQARQAESDRQRLNALRTDGSVSASDDEHTESGALQARATAEAAARQLELARNRMRYTVLRASRSGVVTAVRAQAGQVVSEGQAVLAIADPGEPEIVVDVPEDHLAAFRTASFKASLAAQPNDRFEVALRELSPQAAAQTRTYRARLKPAVARDLPLGATAMLIAEQAAGETPWAAIPAGAITQGSGSPALWVVDHAGAAPVGTVRLVPVEVHAYRNEEVLVSGVPAGALIVTAGVHKMAPGLRVALPQPVESQLASRRLP